MECCVRTLTCERSPHSAKNTMTNVRRMIYSSERKNNSTLPQSQALFSTASFFFPSRPDSASDSFVPLRMRSGTRDDRDRSCCLMDSSASSYSSWTELPVRRAQ